MKNTILFREVGNYVHVLNYSLGEVQSFSKRDGLFLIKNLEKPTAIKKAVGSESYNFLFKIGKNVNSRKIRGPLLELGSKFSFPTIVNIELNRRCILKCKHCYISSNELVNGKNELFDNYSLDNIKGLFRSLKKIGVFLVILTGGEPFLNKNFQKFLKEATEMGFVLEIFSNLQHLPSWFISKSSKFTIGRIQTSVYSVDPLIHNQITNKKGSFEKTLNNLKILKELGLYVEVATPLMSINFDSRDLTKKYFLNIDISQSFSWPIVNEYYGGKKGKSSLNINKEQFVEFCEENPDFIIKPNFQEDRYICGAGQAIFAISANGDIFPCSQYPKKIGNINKSEIETILKSENMNEIRNLNPKDIKNKDYCYNFCIGNNYSETGDPLKIPAFLAETYLYYHTCLKERRC